MTFGQFFQDNLFLFLMLFAVVGGIIYFEIQGCNAAGQKVNNATLTDLANNRKGTILDLRPAQDYPTATLRAPRISR